MRLLEDFWYGNIDPRKYDTFTCSECKEAFRLITKNEEKLLATFTDEQKELFSCYVDCVVEHQTLSECLLFQHSFSLGVRMMAEALGEQQNR